MATRVKISVSVDPELLDEARQVAGGNLSALVNEALARELRRERMREFVAEEEARLGPVPHEIVADVRAKWPA